MNTSALEAPCPETGQRCTPRCPKFVMIDDNTGGCGTKVAADMLMMIALQLGKLTKQEESNANSPQN